MSTNNLHIKFLLLVAVLSIFCTLAAQAQTGFREPTVNTILPRFAMKSLASGEPTDTLTGWRLGGEGELMFRDDTLCYFYEDTWIVSPELDAANHYDMELCMELTAVSSGTVYNYSVTLEHEGAEIAVTTQNRINLQKDRCDTCIVTLPRLESGTFRIRVKGIGSDGQDIRRALLAKINVRGKYAIQGSIPEVANTSFTIPMPVGYDHCLADVKKAERNTSATDTLAYFGFTGGDYTGATTNATNTKRDADFFQGINKNFPVVFSVPLITMGINDSVHIKFKERKYNPSNIYAYHVIYDADTVTTIMQDIERYDDNWYEHSLSFTPSSPFGVLKIVSENLRKDRIKQWMLLDDLLITQKSMYSYRSIEGFPRQESGDLTVSGLNCNEDYRVLLQFVDEANAYGEEVVSDVLDISVKTTGEHKAMQAGEVLELDGDFEGSVIMDGSCQISGTGRVMGELCYAFTYRTDEWEAVGLPFEPRLLGAFIGGEPYYLRENVDYHLQSYAADGKGGYAFHKMGRLEGFKGYLVKVPSTLTQYDGNTIYIYSEKGIEINAPRTYTYTETFTHLANPCAYALDDPWTVFGAGMIYRYDGEAFRLCTTDDTVKPFESVIVYNGGANTAPRVIRIDGGSSVTNGTGHEVLLATGEGCFALHGYEGRVTVTSLGGMTVHDGWLDDGETVSLPAGAYLVTYGGRTTKVIL